MSAPSPFAVSDPTATPGAVACPSVDRLRLFAEEVQPYEAQLKNYLRTSYPRVRDVDDVVQESYLRLWKSHGAEPIRSAKAFLFTVAKRIALNVVRKNSKAPFVPCGNLERLQVLDQQPDAAAAACAQEKLILLADAVMALPSRCREIIVLRKLQGIPQKEVADRLGISERTVESQTQIGIKRCLAYLQERGLTELYRDE